MTNKYNFKRCDEVNFRVLNGRLVKVLHASKVPYTDNTINIILNEHVIDLSELKCNIGPFSLYSTLKEIWKTTDFGADCWRMNPIVFTFPICMVGVVPSGDIQYELKGYWKINDPNRKLISPKYTLPDEIDYRDL